MATTRFDAVSKLFAERRLSRCQAMRQGGAGLAAAALGAAAGLKVPGAAAAQDATPAAGPTKSETDPSFLFVQSFQSGGFAPKAGSDDTFTLTLDQGLGQTIYFSDRPDRIVGAVPTPAFLDGLGFSEDDPPNAALVVDDAAGVTTIAVVELFDPTYDESTRTATYVVRALEAWQDSLEFGFNVSPADLSAVPASFGAAHLFIDDHEGDPVGSPGVLSGS